MLVESVVNPQSIALAASSDASNAIPFLGLQFFPEMKKSGIDLRWIKTHRNVSPVLAPSNYDALPVLRAREGIAINDTEMPFFRESMQVTERDMIEIGRIADATDPYLASALRGVYDDTTKLIRSAEVVGEVMRMQLLSAANGHPSIAISANGQTYAYNYDPDGSYATGNYDSLTSTKMWSNTSTATPIDDLYKAKKTLAAKGYVARYVIMTTKTFGYLRNNDQVKAALMTTNAAGVIFISDDMVKRIVRDVLGLEIVVYDKTYIDYDGNTKNFYPDDTVTILPDTQLGRTWYGSTPAERSQGVVTNAQTAIYGTGIAITTEPEMKSGVYKFTTTASEIVLPSFEMMDATYVIKVVNP